MTILPFDKTKLCLGNLCGRGHRWNDTEQSLRHIHKRECVECKKEVSRIYREKNRDRLLESKKLDYQKNKARYAQINKAYREEHKEELRLYCKQYRVENAERLRLRRREWKKRNPDKVKASRQRYQTNNRAVRRLNLQRYRTRKREAHTYPYTLLELETRINQFDRCCAYCQSGLDCGVRGWSQIDHFLPLSKGGTDTIGNLVPACISCNSAKCDRDPFDWFSKQPFFSKERWLKILKVLGKTDANYTQLTLF